MTQKEFISKINEFSTEGSKLGAVKYLCDVSRNMSLKAHKKNTKHEYMGLIGSKNLIDEFMPHSNTTKEEIEFGRKLLKNIKVQYPEFTQLLKYIKI